MTEISMLLDFNECKVPALHRYRIPYLPDEYRLVDVKNTNHILALEKT